MFDPNQRSKAFNFALKTQDNFGLIIGAFIIWSFWAIFFSNLVLVILIYNFSAIKLQYTDIFYNAFFTFLFYPAVWGIFNFYSKMMVLKHDD